MIKYSKQAIQDLKKIQNPFKRQIANKIESFTSELHSNVTNIQGTKGVFRIRSGDYRIIIMHIGNKDFEVVSIGIRKNVYGGH